MGLGVAAVAHEAADLTDDFAVAFGDGAVAKPAVGVILRSVEGLEVGRVVGAGGFRPFFGVFFCHR